LIDREHQRRGIGKQVLDLVIDHAKRTGAPRLDVSWHQGKGSPERFYLDYGFVQTGMKLGDEVEASLDLSHP
jgi:GNAT superfamily N-acetyltransferase